MTTLQDRLKVFLEYLEIPMQTFERECGIGQGLGSKLSTKSYATTFKRISTAYPQLDINWLKTGEGEMLNAAKPLSSDSNTPSVSSLLDIIRSQQETIRSLSETVRQLAKDK